MGAVEHLKTLCCLGLKPESAMVAVVPLLHEIIPHGWTRLGLLALDATVTDAYSEHPGCEALFRERLWRFRDDPSALISLWVPTFRAVAIGWTLHRQGGGYLESGYYREVEAPLRFLLDFGRDDWRWRPEYRCGPPHAPAQRAPLHGGRRSTARPAPALARARVPAI